MTRLFLLAPLLLAACQDRPPRAEPDDRDAARAAIANEQAAEATIMTDARITALQNQVNALAAEVSELKAGRQAIDTSLLSQRVDAVEQHVYAAAPDAGPTTRPTPAPTPTARPTPKPAARPTPKPTPTPRRKQPDAPAAP